MDKMSLFSVLTVTVPETILNIYIAFLITSEKTHLYWEDRINIIRLLLSTAVVAICVATVRALMPNVPSIGIVNIIIFSLVLKFVYKLRWNKSLIAGLIAFAVIASIEFLYMYQVIAITGTNLNDYFSSDIYRFIITIPTRLLQLFLIITLWNWNWALFSLKEYKEIKSTFIGLILILTSVEIIYMFIVLRNMGKMPLSSTVVCSVGFLLFSVLNFYLFKFISALTNAVSKKELSEMFAYKKQVKSDFISTYNSIKSGDIESAKKICEKFFS